MYTKKIQVIRGIFHDMPCRRKYGDQLPHYAQRTMGRFGAIPLNIQRVAVF